ncbi:hypothetical protein HOLleu_41034 [Holothuria leucospilota]|uniref:Uncharacterized protein n=1 Tax=Holothuria leucospilota TaxID=206669 RepID=A0A9Q0YDD4_HOLLE|nr:hypothetical protein HOLleu_41034 [Holothuria leucospilota]
MAATQSKDIEMVEEALDLDFQLEEEDRRRQIDEGSDSSDDDVVCFRRSGPSEPALQDSVFLEDPATESEDEVLGELAEPLPPQPQQQQQQPPPAKRPRGRPKKPSTEAQPPPKRPPTPKPVLDTNQRQAFQARCAERDAQFRAFRSLKNPTPAQVEGYWSLQVEDEIDRKRCVGTWKWDEFTESKAALQSSTGTQH